jgi:diguanylate cyclase (GGDEF)-like protein/PAS domain S-box-containing protein
MRSLWALPAFGLLLIVAVWTATWLQLQSNERGLVARVAEETEAFATSFEQSTRHAIEDADRLALLVKYEYEAHGALDLSPLMQAGVIDAQSVVLVSIIDADGKLIASSRPLLPIQVADRDYFRRHKAVDTGRLDISQPVIGRSSGRPIIQLSRRMNHRDGSFAGIVLLSVTPDYFTQFYSESDLGSLGRLGLVGLDGVYRARRVGSVTTSTGDGSAAALVARAEATPVGLYESTDGGDGVARIVAYRKLRDYPVIVTVAAARSEALAGFVASRNKYLVIAALATAVILVFFSAVTVLAIRLQRHRRSLKRERQFLESILDNLPVGIAVRSMRPGAFGRYVLWNEAREAMFGVKAEAALGKTLADRVGLDAAASTLELDRQMLASPMVQESEEVRHVPNRGQRIFQLVRAPVFGADDRVDYIMSSATDITEERARVDELRLASKVFETTADGIMLSDVDDRVIMINAAFSRLTGFSAAEMLGLQVPESPFRATDPAQYAVRMERLRREGCVTGDVMRYAKDGATLSLWITATCVRDAEGRIVNYVRVFTDISLLKTTQQKLEQLASFDPLTGLPNRRLLQDRLGQALSRAERTGSSMALMFIDLDGFKEVNDSLGHDVGDLLLCEVAARLQRCIRASDTIGRFGGDEFAIVVEEASSPADLVMVGERIVAALAAPFRLDGRRVHTGASIGIALYPSDGTDATTLLKNADVAMYKAKRSGRNRFEFFSDAGESFAPAEQASASGLGRPPSRGSRAPAKRAAAGGAMDR